MAVDTLLVIDDGETLTADKDTDYIECEGGMLAWAHMYWGAMSGGSTTCDVRVMVSPDGGVTYYMKAKFQQVGPTNDNAEDRVPVYIPQPETAGAMVRVRLNVDVAGSSPSYVITKCILEPMTSMFVPAVDEQLETGAASQISQL